MFDLTAFDLEFRPETYWPEGFVPFVAEDNPPPVHTMDPDGNVYEAEDGAWYYVTFPDEIALVTFGGVNGDVIGAHRDGDHIRFRYVAPEDPDIQITPPLFSPGITEAPAPLSLRELITLVDTMRIANGDMEPDTVGMAAYFWDVDRVEGMTRTERLFVVNMAPHIASPVYPELGAYYQRIGGDYVQTGEIFRLEGQPWGDACDTESE